ncbi:AAA family ATPase [Vibrio parahaemolyticus]|uniref:AAA family ATPase n=3 Tax=Vibrio parahaemolyticus TaxID=670 RepID=UPI000D726548|nr:AAA family ATPase [Vibrio parahaemolyticus]MDF4285461.1 AAA family ATPase [Vibrio parahaemolyticus]MDF4966716.1 AAA family ATPase [Vibrio parahaemolyticus]MDF5029420.1 AAA family ATPase [Vibrio parahaemolyticus]MDF5063598.1 AAA family ATPase [Vibrio parahaemolyticus]MDF5088654.1 AAA family ATPase [Vibrio parahaemolyticus]
MRLKTLKLRNFKGIDSLDLDLDKNLTVFVGVNGSGKSSTLDSIATLLSWITSRTKSNRSSGRPITENQVKNGSKHSSIALEATDNLNWKLVKTRSGYNVDEKSDLVGLKNYTDSLREAITSSHESCAIPLFAYYPINRAVLDIPLRIRNASKFSLLEAWDESLTSASNFRSFFSWFRQREDLENENRSYIDSKYKPENWEFPDRQLTCVRTALTKFLPEFEDFRVRRNPLRLTVRKRGEELSIEQLSDGEKCMIALIGDIARRLAMANPNEPEPINGEGIVLIDEFDMHLHPQWQRLVINKLPEVFENIQFIVTTHSPQAIGEVRREQTWLLQQDTENFIRADRPRQSYGLTSNDILNEVMRDKSAYKQITRNSVIEEKLDTIFNLIALNKLSEASSKIELLEDLLGGEIPELVRAKMSLELSGWDD